MVAHHCSIIYRIAQNFGINPSLTILKIHLFVKFVSSSYKWTNWRGFLLPLLLIMLPSPPPVLLSLLDTVNEDEGEEDRSFEISTGSTVPNGSISKSLGPIVGGMLLSPSSSLSSSLNLKVEESLLCIVKPPALENLCFKLVDLETKNKKH
uniref:1 putative transmembrane span n=1 Tax=Saccharomyces cerevisiae TaxID=4932 RepID=E9PA60_YEASX|nr:1 putative transmembrane span [Saccharomyces cerevisiae]